MKALRNKSKFSHCTTKRKKLTFNLLTVPPKEKVNIVKDVVCISAFSLYFIQTRNFTKITAFFKKLSYFNERAVQPKKM